jgi:hypothetical protein
VYKLDYPKAVEAVWDALPYEAEAELERALQYTALALLVIDEPLVRRVYLLNIDYLG